SGSGCSIKKHDCCVTFGAKVSAASYSNSPLYATNVERQRSHCQKLGKWRGICSARARYGQNYTNRGCKSARGGERLILSAMSALASRPRRASPPHELIAPLSETAFTGEYRRIRKVFSLFSSNSETSGLPNH